MKGGSTSIVQSIGVLSVKRFIDECMQIRRRGMPMERLNHLGKHGPDHSSALNHDDQ